MGSKLHRKWTIMATGNGTETSSKQIKHEDLVQFLNIFASEFNNDNIHDRVLVFEIIEELEEESKAETSVRSGDLQDSQDSEEESVTESSADSSTSGEEEESRAETSKKNPSISKLGKVDLDETKRNVVEDDKECSLLALRTIVMEKKEKEEGKKRGKKAEREEVSNKESDLGNNMIAEETKTTKLFVHSSWLAVHSSYFKALFFSGMKESQLKEVVMKVKQSELQAHLTLIEAMYKLDVLDDKDCCLVVEVLQLADKYDVNIVFKKCKCVLISSSISLEKCEYIVKIVSGIPDCNDVLRAMEKFLVKEFSPLDKTWLLVKFRGLSKESLKLLLGSDKLVVESENTVFVALMEWIGCHRKEGIRNGLSLLSLVRFELMTVNFMHDIVRHDPMAQQLDGFNELLHNGLAYHAFSLARLRDLKVKPVSRCAYRNPDPTFSWVIDQIEQEMLIDDGVIQTNSFWLMGYQMKLKLRYYQGEPNDSYSLFLFVQNIKNDAHIEISWEAESELFAQHVNRVRKTYSNSSKGFGGGVESSIAPSKGPNTLPRTIDVWVNIF